MAEDIFVIGAGGFGREALDVIEAINDGSIAPSWRVIGVIDDAPSDLHLGRLRKSGYSHAGSMAVVLAAYGPASYAIGIGDPTIKRRIANTFDAAGWRSVILVHPAAVKSSSVEIGLGTIVCAGVQLSTNTSLGVHVHLNAGVLVGHDSVIEDYVSVNPGAIVSGDVRVGEETLVGAGAVVLQGLAVGKGATVGASACVTRDVPAASTVKGVPAR